MHLRSIQLLTATALLAAALPAHAEVLPDGWPYRRAVAFKQATSDAPGDNIAWVEFFSNGAHKADGSDIRVTAADRQVVPHRIMQVSGDNDFVRVAFATKGDGPYYVWWGNDKAAAPAKDLEIKRGIYAEIFRYTEGRANDQKSMDKLYERAGKPMGALFVPEVFLGHNPLGEEWSALIRYSAVFRIDRAINAEWAYSVNDSGYLLINDKLIQQRYSDGWSYDARNAKKVDLPVGFHALKATQANINGGNTGVVVAWRRPGDKNFEPLPRAIFTPVATGNAGPLEQPKAGGAYTADFTIDPVAEAFTPPEHYMQRWVFDAVYPDNWRPKITWQFGDGQTDTTQKKVHHYYLTPGTYTVTLTIENGGNRSVATRRISIKDRMYQRFPKPREDDYKTVSGVLADYDLTKLSGDALFRGMAYFKAEAQFDEVAKWGRAFVAHKDPFNERVLIDEVFDLSRLFQLRKDYKASAEVYRLAAGKQVSMETKLRLMLHHAGVLCDYLDDGPGALAALQEAERQINPANKQQRHTLLTAMAYAAVARGDAKLAQKSIDDAGVRVNRNYNDMQIRQGVLARNIENYIRTKEYDTAVKLIDTWHLEYPDSIWDGFTRTLYVKLLAAEGRPLVAARVALQHARANPNGFYAAELLYRASQHFKAAGEETQSKAALDLLKSKYPESPYATERIKEDPAVK